MTRENQRISNHNVLLSCRNKHHNLSNVVRRQRINASVDCIGLVLVAVEPHHAELGLYLAGINLHDADARGDQLLAQGIGEAAHGGLGGAVDGSSGVRLAAGDGADVNDVARTTFVSAGLKDGQDGLGHVNEAGDVGGEHDVDVGFGDGWGLGDFLCIVFSIIQVSV